MDPGLPPVLADREKLKRALLNLCKNAEEAMPEGGTLTVRLRASDGKVILEVCDTGIGVPEGLNLLEPFATTKPLGAPWAWSLRGKSSLVITGNCRTPANPVREPPFSSRFLSIPEG